MSKFLPMVFLIGLFFFMWLVLFTHQRIEKRKRALPLREDYLAAQGRVEPACHACGKDQLKDEGLGSGRDTRRIVSCAACATLLYRYELPAEADADD